jgi:beta-galactosidase
VCHLPTRRTGAFALGLLAAASIAFSGLAVLGLLPGGSVGPASSATPATSPFTGERTVDFDSGWKFRLVNSNDTDDPSRVYGNASVPKASAVGFDDSSWRSVTLPHDWSIELSPQATGVGNATGYFPGGLGWYRKTFLLPSALAGKSVSLRFDGVYVDAWLYLNGRFIGNHAYGYTGFAVDITAVAHIDGVTPNVLAVVVQNKEPNSRWYSGSGITRNTWLTVTDPVHVTRGGIDVTTPAVEKELPSGFATVQAEVETVDDTGRGANVTVAARVIDASGAVVGESTSESVVAGASPASRTLDVKVAQPHLWSTSDPYLYTLQADVTEGGRVVDSDRTTFGIRWLRFDPDTGFSLNGEPLKLHGANLHNDEGALGSVDNADAIHRELTTLQGMGVNAVRSAHNPPSPEFLAACDRLGILVVDEAFDVWAQAKLRHDYSTEFKNWSDSDIEEMVREARNSPSVIMWSIGNEIRDFTDPASLATAERLIADVRSLDSSRPVVAASDQYRSLPAIGSGADAMLGLLDGLGVNYESAQALDALHAQYPDKFFFQSESSSEESSRGAYSSPDAPNAGVDYTPGNRAGSSYDNTLASWTTSAEYALKNDRDRPFDMGEFLWSGFDYIGEPTPYDVFPVKSSFFGAVDTAGLPKDAYYLYQSQWTGAPMVHIVPMDWTDHRPGENVSVWVYSNVKTVELRLDGRSLGARSFDTKTAPGGRPYLETTEPSGDDRTFPSGSYTSPNGSSGKLHLTWEVPFEAGRLEAIAIDGGSEVASDHVDTAGPAAALHLVPDRLLVPADGRSLAYLEVDVIDAKGVVVPDADDRVEISVSGGVFEGADSGRQESTESYKAASHSAYNGKLVLIVGSSNTPGPLEVTVRAAGLAPATVTVFSVAAAGGGRELVGLEPVRVRVPAGSGFSLPATVEAVRADGSVSALDVAWQAVPPAARTTPGAYVVRGAVAGTDLVAEADLDIYAMAGIETVSSAVARGALPLLPPSVHVAFTDGTDAYLPVSWDQVDPARFSGDGLVTISGMVAGTSMPAQASIRVAEPVGPTTNLAAAGTPAEPVAGASFSGSPDAVPAAMIDGVDDKGGWSNYYATDPTALLPSYSRADASDWVSVSWRRPQSFDRLEVTFVTDDSRTVPSALAVELWNGRSWVPADDVRITPGTAGEPTDISFDLVAARGVRLTMTSAAPGTATGFIGIAELQVLGRPIVYHSVASLTSLSLDGVALPGFDASTLDYSAAVAGLPQISAVAAANGSVLVVAPSAIPGTASVIVTSEDGLASQTYRIALTTRESANETEEGQTP